ncbi:site-specific DNA-methyltransferase (adenine-specific) [Streptomyces sp. V4I23]|nr:site-specific DNA-methyltransferase (adenine-specific) [Streptomyces sp. V4I23]
MPNSGLRGLVCETGISLHASTPNWGLSLPFSLHQGDALSVLAGLPDDCVDSVITDPPYNSGGRTAKERTTRSAKQKYTSADAQHALPDFTGENMDQRSYGFWLTQIMTEAHRLTRTGGTALLFTDWRQLPITTDAIQAAGWLWRGVLAWHKPQARPQKGRFTQNCEFIVWASNGPIDASRNPVYLPGLYSASQPSGKARQHITQKPVEVMRELVKIAPPGGTVLDFCAGSGSTGVAALLEDRDFIGVEKTEHYASIAADRLTQTVRETLAQDDMVLTS